MAIPIQRCRYCGEFYANQLGTIPLKCKNCYRLNWAIDTTKPLPCDSVTQHKE